MLNAICYYNEIIPFDAIFILLFLKFNVIFCLSEVETIPFISFQF